MTVAASGGGSNRRARAKRAHPDSVLKDVRVWTVMILAFTQTVFVVNVFSFAPFFIDWMLVSSNRVASVAATNYYTGLMLAAAPLGIFLSATLWGALADRIGRRMSLMIGVFFITVGSFPFGLITSVELAISLQFVMGVLNGNWGIMCTYLEETLWDQQSKNAGFSYLMMCYGLGSVIGPFMGGFLSDPSSKYQFMSDWQLFVDYPFELPYIVNGILNLITLFAIIFFMDESLPASELVTFSDCLNVVFGFFSTVFQNWCGHAGYERIADPASSEDSHTDVATSEQRSERSVDGISPKRRVSEWVMVNVRPGDAKYHALQARIEEDMREARLKHEEFLRTRAESLDLSEMISQSAPAIVADAIIDERHEQSTLDPPQAGHTEQFTPDPCQSIGTPVQSDSVSQRRGNRESGTSVETGSPNSKPRRRKAKKKGRSKSNPATSASIWRDIWTLICIKDYSVPVFVYCATSFMFSSYEAIYPLWAKVECDSGGIGWNTNQIALVFMICGICLTLNNSFTYPIIANRIGLILVTRYALLVDFVVLCGMYPYWLDSYDTEDHSVSKSECRERSSQAMLSVSIANVLLAVSTGSLFTSVTILQQIGISRNQPRMLGLANGFSQSLVSFMRTLAPIVAQALFTLGLSLDSRHFEDRSGILGGFFTGFRAKDMVFYFFGLVCLIAMLSTYALNPKLLEPPPRRRKKRGKRRKKKRVSAEGTAASADSTAAVIELAERDARDADASQETDTKVAKAPLCDPTAAAAVGGAGSAGAAESAASPGSDSQKVRPNEDSEDDSFEEDSESEGSSEDDLDMTHFMNSAVILGSAIGFTPVMMSISPFLHSHVFDQHSESDSSQSGDSDSSAENPRPKRKRQSRRSDSSLGGRQVHSSAEAALSSHLPAIAEAAFEAQQSRRSLAFIEREPPTTSLLSRTSNDGSQSKPYGSL